VSESTAPPNAAPYRVLARKYRPRTFSEMIGQDALVRTLTNAIASGRLAHAFMLTGVRGVGKTTSARIIARALNCIGPDGKGGPTPEPCGVCANCVAIAQDRHVDVMEMDAASRTGVDDIREIIDGVRYAPVQARFKVYIIDEVHMLTKNAFNALLKTLEEPPEHVKFLFATTEIRKVPVTVLSRCQRFDLRRIDATVLAEHFARLLAMEGLVADADAVALIARAADGSARDGLSLLDQAIALADGTISANQVRDMLGLADRTRIVDLFEQVMGGHVVEALATLAHLHTAGADPQAVLQDLLDVTHTVTRIRVSPETALDVGLPEAERAAGKRLAEILSIPVLTRAWQVLLKGLDEVQRAPLPQQAAEMTLIRLCHMADMPTPGDLAKILREGGDLPSILAGLPPVPPSPPDVPRAHSASPRAALTVIRGGAQPALAQAPEPQDAISAALPIHAQAPAPVAPAPSLSIVSAAADSDEAGDDEEKLEPVPQSFAEVVRLLERSREGLLAAQLRGAVHLVAYTPGELTIRIRPEGSRDLPRRIGPLLERWTGRPWLIHTSAEPGEPTLDEVRRREERAVIDRAAAHPAVRAVLEAFPGATIDRVFDTTTEPTES
jgi:DNA polymerase III subunit gamma/tau